jgi:hypothetical protein
MGFSRSPSSTYRRVRLRHPHLREAPAGFGLGPLATAFMNNPGFGSWLAAVAPSEIVLAGLALNLASNLPIVFFISGALRLIVSLSLLRTFREARSVEPISHRRLVLELPLIKPLTDTFGGGGRRDS